jgi:hypothetical protein
MDKKVWKNVFSDHSVNGQKGMTKCISDHSVNGKKVWQNVFSDHSVNGKKVQKIYIRSFFVPRFHFPRKFPRQAIRNYFTLTFPPKIVILFPWLLRSKNSRKISRKMGSKKVQEIDPCMKARSWFALLKWSNGWVTRAIGQASLQRTVSVAEGQHLNVHTYIHSTYPEICYLTN